MRYVRILIAAGLSAAVLATCASSADAGWSHRGYYGHGGYYGRGGYYGHGGPGLVGGVVIGALTLATLPFAILGAATSPPPPPPYYGPGYGPAPYGYGPPPPPRGYYGQPYGPPPGYGRQYGPPPGYYDGN
jgi:hypothetical protein